MADKNPVVNITKMESSEGNIATSSSPLTSVTTTKVASTRPRRGVEDNSNNPSQNSTESTPVVATVTTRTRKTAEETPNLATNGKAAPAGRATRNKPVVSDNSNNSSDGGNGNNNSASSGANGTSLSGSKDDNTMGGNGKTAAPTEEQRTMKTRSAK